MGRFETKNYKNVRGDYCKEKAEDALRARIQTANETVTVPSKTSFGSFDMSTETRRRPGRFTFTSRLKINLKHNNPKSAVHRFRFRHRCSSHCRCNIDTEPPFSTPSKVEQPRECTVFYLLQRFSQSSYKRHRPDGATKVSPRSRYPAMYIPSRTDYPRSSPGSHLECHC